MDCFAFNIFWFESVNFILGDFKILVSKLILKLLASNLFDTLSVTVVWSGDLIKLSKIKYSILDVFIKYLLLISMIVSSEEYKISNFLS